MPPEPPDFDPVPMLAALERHGVRAVVIGAMGARLRGAPIVTGDLDVTPAPDRENLERLVAALDDLGATFRMGTITTDEPLDADVLEANDVVQTTTRHGSLDITKNPSGTRGYDDLILDAGPIDVEGVTATVASLADVIRSKQAAGRPKDTAQLVLLRETLERIREREQRQG